MLVHQVRKLVEQQFKLFLTVVLLDGQTDHMEQQSRLSLAGWMLSIKQSQELEDALCERAYATFALEATLTSP